MAFCTECGHQLAEGAKFCYECGAKVNGECTPNTGKRKTVYDGEIHKCPNCGEIIKSFAFVCPTCGYELRGAKAVNSVKELASKLEQIEQTREHTKARSLVGRLYGSDGQITKTDEQKISLIRSFSIPNTKEDIVEFMILASTNIDLKLYGLGNQGIITASQRAVSDAWLAKFEQAYEKASFTFGSAPEFLSIKKMYEKKIKKLNWKKCELVMLVGGLFLFLIVECLFIKAIS